MGNRQNKKNVVLCNWFTEDLFWEVKVLVSSTFTSLFLKNYKKGAWLIIQLAYSFHLGSDKNKKNSSKASAKSNISGTTSKSNNAIQNAAGLTKCDNHNYRKYDDRDYDIEIIRGSSSLVDDVKKLYKD